MPVGHVYDYTLNGNGYMLLRQQGARSWVRGGKPDTPDQRAFSEEQYGVLPSDLERPVVWDDWSGGYGEAYRRLNRVGFHLAESNKYHWAENFDTRFPKQLVHAQQPMQFNTSGVVGSPGYYSTAANSFIDVPPVSVANQSHQGEFMVLALGVGWQQRITPLVGPSTFDTFSSTYGFISAVEVGPANISLGNKPAIFGSFTYMPVLSGTYALFRTMSGVWSLLGSLPAVAFAGAGNQLWRAFAPDNSVIRSANLQNLASGKVGTAVADWSATYTVGNGQNSISDMISLKDTLYVGMANGLWAGDFSGTFYNVLSELEGQQHQDNCRDLTIYQNQVIAPHLNGIFAYEPSTTTPRARDIGPVSHSNRSPVRGLVRAVRAYGPWLYAGLYTGSQSYLLAGRPQNDPNYGENFQWHVLNRLPHPAKIHRLYIDSITASSGSQFKVPNRMWVATDASIDTGGTAPVYWWPIPALNDNPLNAVPPFSANYVGSARIDLGYVDFQAPSTPKIFRSVEVTADKLASGAVYANVYYTVDNGTRTLLGLVATSPKSTLFFPNGSGNWVGGHAIELSLESFTATQALTPIYRSIVLRGSLRPRSVDLITAVTRIADRMHNRQNTEMRPGAVQVSELRALASSSYPSTLVDIAGATQIVDVLEPIEEHEIWQEGADSPELAVSVKMAVLSFTSG